MNKESLKSLFQFTRVQDFWVWLPWFDCIIKLRAETIQEQVENFTKEFEKCNQK